MATERSNTHMEKEGLKGGEGQSGGWILHISAVRFQIHICVDLSSALLKRPSKFHATEK